MDNKTSTDKGNNVDNTMITEVLHTRTISHVHSLWSITMLKYQGDPSFFICPYTLCKFHLRRVCTDKIRSYPFSVNHPIFFSP
jgi:hypothetical protein